MKKYIQSLFFCFFLGVEILYASCDDSTKKELIKVIEQSHFKDTQKLQSLYERCNDDVILMLLFLSKGDNFEDKDQINQAIMAYKAALNALAPLDKTVYGVADLKKYLIAQLDKYGSIDAEAINKNHIGTRGFRGAELVTIKKLPIPLNFEVSKSEIKKGVNLTQVSNIAKALDESQYKDKVIYITGFTDTRGKPDYNAKLGERRAMALKTYLQEYGLTNKMFLDSEGEEDPICIEGNVVEAGNEGYKCSVKEDYYSSRRVEIIVGNE